ncbi:MAG: hypothetical protein ABI229_05210 [Gemmatimonadaceae bacterium]
MLSPVNGRRIGEWALRVLSMALLAVIVMRTWAPTRGARRAERVGQAAIADALPRLSMTEPARVHLALDSALTPDQRDWFAAIQRVGTIITWSGPHIAATAATQTRVVDPAGASELSVTTTPKSIVTVRDDIGIIDSLTAGSDGIRVEIPGTENGVGVSAGASTAWASAPDSVVFKRLLVEGSASWETKFTIAALSERGWKVDAITHVAPGIDVREGSPAAPDTSRYAAIIAVDSTASLVAERATSFVRNGGGLVTLRDASGVGPREAASIVLERRADGDIRASRFGNGRVIRVGYRDLWRYRMTDSDTVPDPVVAHRELLARIVASVAYAPRIPVQAAFAADPAPLADMVERIGARSASLDAQSPLGVEVSSAVLFGILLASLLLELASRRLRGAK